MRGRREGTNGGLVVWLLGEWVMAARPALGLIPSQNPKLEGSKPAPAAKKGLVILTFSVG
jgi:hypothetical protein